MRRNLFAIGVIAMLVITGFSTCDSEFTGSGRKPERTLTFLPGDGEGDPHPEKALDGENYTLPNATTAFSMTAPEKKRFSGWKDGGEGNLYKVNDTYTVKRSVTFIAQWKAAGTPDAPKVKQGASSVSDLETAITITWEEASGADSYILYCKKYESFPSTTGLTEVASGITSISYKVERDNNKIPLEQGVDYTFYVKAVNVAGESPYSDPVTYRLKPPANRLFFDKNGDWGQIYLLNVKDMGITSPVTAGTYTFAIHGTADKNIGRIGAQLVDNKAGNWNTLSNYNSNLHDMKAGEPFFQVSALTVEEGAHSDPEDAVLALFISKDDNENKNISIPSSISYTSMSLAKNEANQITLQTAYSDTSWNVDIKASDLGWNKPIQIGQTYILAIEGSLNYGFNRITTILAYNKDPWRALSDYNSGIAAKSRNETFKENIYITTANAPDPSYGPDGVIVQLSISNNEIQGGVNEPIRLSGAKISLMNAF
ncbi:MAG: fibronectin type III domain-containing protein [Treponema sp.]|nr:fibronectin type III domain-containing protein [Treponema sp.]